MAESAAVRRYGHREDCVLIFDLEPLFVVESQDPAGATIYIIGDKFGQFTTNEKPSLTEEAIRNSLIDYRAAKQEKIHEGLTGLEYL